jgi:hypothetical protein
MGGRKINAEQKGRKEGKEGQMFLRFIKASRLRVVVARRERQLARPGCSERSEQEKEKDLPHPPSSFSFPYHGFKSVTDRL